MSPYPLSPTNDEEQERDLLMSQFGHDWTSSYFQPISEANTTRENDESLDDLLSVTSMESITIDIFESSSSAMFETPTSASVVESTPRRKKRARMSIECKSTPAIDFSPATTSAFSPYSNAFREKQKRVLGSSGLVSLGSQDEGDCSSTIAGIESIDDITKDDRYAWVPSSVTCPVMIGN